ncbi:DUF7344 domain-containing protein [Halostella pelagica]|uniref:DUF7344 domain-containing protein n=1 Tax=Halostella pelagica TaxID=2583824 RepID=UPI001080CD21|nr:hypothetical protein [Halostella pelagica]
MGAELEDMEVSMDRVKKELRNSRRRYTLFYVKNNDGSASLDDVVDKITAWENNGEVPESKTSHRKSVYSSLYQRHLPRLVELGILSYNRENRTLSLTEVGEQISLKVATHDHDCRSFSKLFFALGILNAVILLLGGLKVVSPLAVFTWGSIIITVFLILALLQFYDYRSWKRAFENKGPDYVVEIDR